MVPTRPRNVVSMCRPVRIAREKLSLPLNFAWMFLHAQCWPVKGPAEKRWFPLDPIMLSPGSGCWPVRAAKEKPSLHYTLPGFPNPAKILVS